MKHDRGYMVVMGEAAEIAGDDETDASAVVANPIRGGTRSIEIDDTATRGRHGQTATPPRSITLSCEPPQCLRKMTEER